MSEPRMIEHYDFNDNILQYADEKYQYAIMRDLMDEGTDYVWLLTETKENAIARLEVETNAYTLDPDENACENFHFYVSKIERKEVPRGIKNKTRIQVSQNRISGLDSENYRT